MRVKKNDGSGQLKRGRYYIEVRNYDMEVRQYVQRKGRTVGMDVW